MLVKLAKQNTNKAKESLRKVRSNSMNKLKKSKDKASEDTIRLIEKQVLFPTDAMLVSLMQGISFTSEVRKMKTQAPWSFTDVVLVGQVPGLGLALWGPGSGEGEGVCRSLTRAPGCAEHFT